jgi:hypothetical protein
MKGRVMSAYQECGEVCSTPADFVDQRWLCGAETRVVCRKIHWVISRAVEMNHEAKSAKKRGVGPSEAAQQGSWVIA